MRIYTYLASLGTLGLTYGAGLLFEKGTIWAAVLFDIMALILCFECCYQHVKTYDDARVFRIIAVVAYAIFPIVAIVLLSIIPVHETSDLQRLYIPVIFSVPMIAYDEYIRFLTK